MRQDFVQTFGDGTRRLHHVESQTIWVETISDMATFVVVLNWAAGIE